MFQLSDDLLDIESDLKNNKPNICSIIDASIVTNLLKNGCDWLYINAIYIHKMMESIELETDTNYNVNTYNVNTYNVNTKNKKERSKLSFDIKAINEIILKIENRIK